MPLEHIDLPPVRPWQIQGVFLALQGPLTVPLLTQPLVLLAPLVLLERMLPPPVLLQQTGPVRLA